MKEDKYIIRGYYSQDDWNHFKGCVYDAFADTIKEAKTRAKYIMSEDFKRSSEMGDRLMYVQILNNDSKEECLYDFFGK